MKGEKVGIGPFKDWHFNQHHRMERFYKRRWVRELRSGKYRQFPHWLRSAPMMAGGSITWSALGVLCNIVNPYGWHSPNNPRCGPVSHEISCCIVRPSWNTLFDAKLTDVDMEVIIDLEFENKTFDEIADWIEENL